MQTKTTADAMLYRTTGPDFGNTSKSDTIASLENGTMPAHRAVENVDRFFEAYERFLPRYFGEMVIAALLLAGIVFLAL